MNVKKMVVVVSLLSCFCVSCFNPIEPPSALRLNRNGEAIVQQSVFLLKTLRLAYDLRSINNLFEPGSVVDDPLRLSPVFWNEMSASSYLSRGFTKTKAAERPDLLSSVKKVLAQSAVQNSALIFAYDTVAYDTVFRLATDTTQWIGVRTLADSLLNSVFIEGRDSIYWHFATVDTAHEDTLRTRIMRLCSNTDDSVFDLRRWDSTASGWNLVRRQQQQTVGGQRFSHTAIFAGGVLSDSLVVITPTVKQRFNIVRQDNSTDWWRSLDSSTIISYSDSAFYADSTISQTLSDTDAIILDVDLDAAQFFSVTVVRLSDQNRTRTETRETMLYNPVLQTTLIRSFSSTESKGSGDTTTCLLSALDSAFTRADTCSLTVTIKLSSINYDSTRFGMRTKSTYTALLIHSPDWDTLRYLSLYRKDLLTAASNLSYAEWIQIPKQPAIWGVFSGIPQTIIARSVNGLGDSTKLQQWSRSVNGLGDSTKLQQWSRSDTGAVVAYSQFWVGSRGDTLRIKSRVLGSTVAYDADSANGELRYGSLTLNTPLRTLDDTLITAMGSRYTHGTINSRGEGSFVITGSEQWQLRITADSVIVTGVAGEYPLSVATVAWGDSSGTYVSHYTDAGRGLTVVSRIAVDDAGALTGSWIASNSIGAVIFQGLSVKVSAHKTGSAVIYGVASDAGSSLATNCSINLWHSNNLGGEYLFY